MNIYYDKDADLSIIRGKKVAIIGYGYWFYAEGIGPIARIERRNVSALLVYNEKLKEAEVLLERR